MMMLCLSMAGFALDASISPGPVNVVALSSGASHGLSATLRHVAGATLGFVLLLVLAGLGLAELLRGWPAAATLTRWAGVAFLLHYVTDVSFGKLFFAVNLPFYWFAWTRMGREFTVKTFVCVGLLSLLTELFPHVMHVDYLNPLFAALLGGLLLGTGCLFLARHRSSLGGATVVSLYLQGRYGMRAGKVQMVIDGTVVLLALFVVPVERVVYSVLAVLVMSGFLWISHRPGRYVGH